MKRLILLIGIACLPTAVSYGVLQCQKCAEAHAKDKEKSLFSCDRIETMAKHLFETHDVYMCCNCRWHFKDFIAYLKHVLAIHKKYACRYCVWRYFETKDAYERHKDIQHIDYQWSCNTCREHFPTLERFAIHATVFHKLYVCLYCAQKKAVPVKMFNFKDSNRYIEHMRKIHGEFICTRCNLRDFGSAEALDKHCNKYRHKTKAVHKLCTLCGHLNRYRYEAEKMLHELQHAFLLFFLEKTICGYACCVPFQKALSGKTREKFSEEEKNPKIEAVRAFVTHVLQEHKRCLFCENPVTDASQKVLEKNLKSMTYDQIAQDARMFIRLNENTFPKNGIPVIHCEMCALPLQPNRKSRLFFASITQFPFGKGLDIPDYPFHHVEYDERKAEENTIMSVIKEVPANEEESCFIPKKEEKDDVILGEEDEAEDEKYSGEEEEEDKKDDGKEPEPKDLEVNSDGVVRNFYKPAEQP